MTIGLAFFHPKIDSNSDKAKLAIYIALVLVMFVMIPFSIQRTLKNTDMAYPYRSAKTESALSTWVSRPRNSTQFLCLQLLASQTVLRNPNFLFENKSRNLSVRLHAAEQLQHYLHRVVKTLRHQSAEQY